MSAENMRLKDVLEVIYDTLAGNPVDPDDAEYVKNAVNHIDFMREQIVFTHQGAAYALILTEIDPDRVME